MQRQSFDCTWSNYNLAIIISQLCRGRGLILPDLSYSGRRCTGCTLCCLLYSLPSHQHHSLLWGGHQHCVFCTLNRLPLPLQQQTTCVIDLISDTKNRASCQHVSAVHSVLWKDPLKLLQQETNSLMNSSQTRPFSHAALPSNAAGLPCQVQFWLTNNRIIRQHVCLGSWLWHCCALATLRRSATSWVMIHGSRGLTLPWIRSAARRRASNFLHVDWSSCTKVFSCKAMNAANRIWQRGGWYSCTVLLSCKAIVQTLLQTWLKQLHYPTLLQSFMQHAENRSGQHSCCNLICRQIHTG